jgi:hypothetical protein
MAKRYALVTGGVVTWCASKKEAKTKGTALRAQGIAAFIYEESFFLQFIASQMESSK